MVFCGRRLIQQEPYAPSESDFRYDGVMLCKDRPLQRKELRPQDEKLCGSLDVNSPKQTF